MGDPSARHSRAGRLLNGLLIFKTIYGMSVNLLDIFHIKAFSGVGSLPCWQTPTIYARRLSCPELHWLTVPGKARMGNQYHFVVDSANLHPAFLSLAEIWYWILHFYAGVFADTAQRLLPQ